MSSPNWTIRPATKADLTIIERWLATTGELDSLAVNWPTTLRVFNEKGILVVADKSDEAVAYFWGSLETGESILEVRHDLRRHGIGSYLVSFLIAEARADGASELMVECSPHTSTTFWQKMGFTISRIDHKFIGRGRLTELANAI